MICLVMVSVFTPLTPFQTEAVTKVGKLPKETVAQIKLTSVDGQQFSLAGLRGKVVVMDFFGIHCAHSRDHIRDTMTQFSDNDFKRGLQIIGIESEDATVQRVRQFIQDEKINYPIVQIDEPTFIQYVESKDLSAPQTLIFGRDGKLLLHTLGHGAKIQTAIRETIQKALN
ncbi:MAG: TlpA family protein disulfide reductase [Acidobacteria bacterium]|nr:TlpA family protein disulfide reductase [Acidobacteriota bacterium]